ncbi:MAG TPA: zinc/iron-chelating domain-containing protein [Flavobacteriales bacterium]|nr:zinc/iron-chelating domain-containing protein [Flavobacteriales bacterium]|tara:strand:- start:74541 stop:75035 length:495 start_codon:yes stop_codon:yes gene_type:complete
MNDDYKKLIESALSKKEENKKLLKQLRKQKDNKIDNLFHQLHEEVFDEIDCLQCANCCSTSSPIFYQRDIERLAKHLKMKPGAFIEQYLHIDEDNDYVLNETPCPFLMPDNYCMVYNARPTACREYPHTNRKRIKQIFSLTLKNSEICPAVALIFEKINQSLDK